jgi:hypothetical protein
MGAVAANIPVSAKTAKYFNRIDIIPRRVSYRVAGFVSMHAGMLPRAGPRAYGRLVWIC